MRLLAHRRLKPAVRIAPLLDLLDKLPIRGICVRKFVGLFIQSPDTPLPRGFACMLEMMRTDKFGRFDGQRLREIIRDGRH